MDKEIGMMTEISKIEFEALDDTQLIWKCIEPVIVQVRGRSFGVKSEAYARMTTAQRALLMFQMLYGHASGGVQDFYTHLSYILSNQGVWDQIKNAMRFFDDEEMLRLVDGMEAAFEEKPERILTINRLDNALHATLPSTQKRVGTYIRSHPDEFVRFAEE